MLTDNRRELKKYSQQLSTLDYSIAGIEEKRRVKSRGERIYYPVRGRSKRNSCSPGMFDFREF
jgi:hypothetical protein